MPRPGCLVRSWCSSLRSLLVLLPPLEGDAVWGMLAMPFAPNLAESTAWQQVPCCQSAKVGPIEARGLYCYEEAVVSSRRVLL